MTTRLPGSRRRTRAWIAALAVLALALAAGGTWWAAHERGGSEPEQLTLVSGLPGGVYHSLGEALQHATEGTDAQLTARQTAASVVNLEMLARGDADVGFALADITALAVSGDGPFDQPLPIRAVARLYDNHTHLVVPAESPVEQLTDLAGATLSVGAAGSGTEFLAHRFLNIAGLDAGHGADRVQTQSMSLSESVHALEHERIDAFFWSAGVPTQALTELAERMPVRLIDLSEWVAPLTERHGAHFEEVPIPVDTYPGVPGVRSVGISSLLVVREDLGADTVEELTETLFDSRADLVQVHPGIRQLSERTAIGTLPVPLHEGAVEYYHRAKVAHRPSPGQD